MSDMHDELMMAEATGGFAGTLNTADTAVDGGAVLARGYWKFNADTDYRIAVSYSGAAATAAGARREFAKDPVILYSPGTLRVTMEAVTSAGNYTADRVHP